MFLYGEYGAPDPPYTYERSSQDVVQNQKYWLLIPMLEAWSDQEQSGRKRKAHEEGIDSNNYHRGISDRKFVTRKGKDIRIS